MIQTFVLNAIKNQVDFLQINKHRAFYENARHDFRVFCQVFDAVVEHVIAYLEHYADIHSITNINKLDVHDAYFVYNAYAYLDFFIELRNDKVRSDYIRELTYEYTHILEMNDMIDALFCHIINYQNK